MAFGSLDGGDDDEYNDGFVKRSKIFIMKFAFYLEQSFDRVEPVVNH